MENAKASECEAEISQVWDKVISQCLKTNVEKRISTEGLIKVVEEFLEKTFTDSEKTVNKMNQEKNP